MRKVLVILLAMVSLLLLLLALGVLAFAGGLLVLRRSRV